MLLYGITFAAPIELSLVAISFKLKLSHNEKSKYLLFMAIILPLAIYGHNKEQLTESNRTIKGAPIRVLLSLHKVQTLEQVPVQTEVFHSRFHPIPKH
jgi:hypothetical protein